MAIVLPLQTTLYFVAFMANLIDLRQFNTILVLHDQTTRNQINTLIETLPTRYDVAWLLVNEYDNPKQWNHGIYQHHNLLILTALQPKNIYPILKQLYVEKSLNKRSKNLIVSSDISKTANTILSLLLQAEINAVLFDWTSDEAVIYAWNPFSARQLVELNETEFLGASTADSTRGKYAGLFFDQLQSMHGRRTSVATIFDSMNVYNITSSDSEVGIDGTEIKIIDLLGEAIQSPMDYIVSEPFSNDIKIKLISLKFIFHRILRTYAPLQRRRIKYLKLPLNRHEQIWMETKLQKSANIIRTQGHTTVDDKDGYPHDFENYVIIVENRLTTTTTATLRVLFSPIMYLWLLFIGIFVAIRCGLQWFNASEAASSASKRRRCLLMCEETVQLSCGVVMNPKLFISRRYRHAILAHGATIIPYIAGMFISGLLYGEYVMTSQVPSIDSIEQLEQSGITVLESVNMDIFRGVKNNLTKTEDIELVLKIWSGNTSYAYIIPERMTALFEVDNFRSNGQPIFHVMKERIVGKYVYLNTGTWFLKNRLNTILMRSQEHGLMKYFKSISQGIFRQISTDMRSKNTMLAAVGGLQEIQIACGIYLVGMSCGMFIFFLEFFSKRNSRKIDIFRHEY